jgi:4a-hydroxytetrahydrobiopterin dehydratase
MGERKRLSEKEIGEKLATLRGWSVANGQLHKEFTFKDFTRAFGFLTSVALIAESMNHHPEWKNVYNRVTIDLMTHDLGGISTMDFEFASRVDNLST